MIAALGVETGRVWMTCTCWAVVNRQLEEPGKWQEEAKQ